MSQRERKPKDEPGRALPNLPKFLQGKPKAPAESAPAPAPPASPPKAPVPAVPATPIATEKPPKPTPAQPPKPATPATKTVGVKTPPATQGVPNAPSPSPAAKVVPAITDQPKPVPKAPAKAPAPPKEPPAEQAKPQDEPAAPSPSAKRSESPRPAARQPVAAPSPAPVTSQHLPPPPTATAREDVPPPAPSPVATSEPAEDYASAPKTSNGDGTDAKEQRNGKNGFAVDDDVLPQAVSFTILREAMAAEKQFRPILFAGPLKRIAKAPVHAAPAALVADHAAAPTLPEPKTVPESGPLESPADVALISPASTEPTQAAPVLAREQRDVSTDAAPRTREAASTSNSEPAVAAHADETADSDAAPGDETSTKERDRREAKRRKQVSSILAAAASRAKAASASETGESETHSPFADPWDHLRLAAAAATHAAGPTIRAEADESEEEITPEKIVRRTPPFVVSLAMHLAVFVLLALLALPALETSAPVVLDMNYATEDSDLLEAIELDLPSEVAVEESDPFSTQLTEMVDPLAGAPELPTEFGSFQLLAPANVAQASVGFSGRDGDMKQALLGAFGGTVATQDAVKLGLGWMKRQQQPDGTWSMAGPYSNAALQPNTTAATAMALLCFFGDGHTPDEGEFRQTVTKGVDALLRSQNSDGAFYAGSEGWHQIYSQAQATIALCELYGMTGEERYRGPAERAVRYCVSTQGADGGWPHYPGQPSDTSVTGWYLMAIKSGEMAGIVSPPETFDRVSAFLDGVQDEGGWRYKRRALDRDYTKFMTAEAVLCREYLGWDKEDPRLISAVNYLLESPPSTSESEAYYWYCASQVMHHYGGERWEEWNDRLRVVLPAMQERKGPEQGSWNPFTDEWGARGGRLYMTALCLYTLEIYYRHLPLYQQAGEGTTNAASIADEGR